MTNMQQKLIHKSFLKASVCNTKVDTYKSYIGPDSHIWMNYDIQLVINRIDAFAGIIELIYF